MEEEIISLKNLWKHIKIFLCVDAQQSGRQLISDPRHYDLLKHELFGR